MGNGAPKGELDGSGICFNFMIDFLPFIFIDIQATFPTSWYQEPQSTLSVKPSIKSWQLCLCAVVYYPETSQRLNTTDHFIFWSPNLQFRKGLFEENSFLMMILLFSLLHFSDLILKCNIVTQWIIKFQLYLSVYIGPQAYEILHTHI